MNFSRRFGIRTLLVVVLLISAPLAWFANGRIKYAKCEYALLKLQEERDISDPLQKLYAEYFIANNGQNLPALLSDSILGRKYNFMVIRGSEFLEDDFTISLNEDTFSMLYGIETLRISPSDRMECVQWIRKMPDLNKLHLTINDLDCIQKLNALGPLPNLKTIYIVIEDAGPGNFELDDRVIEFLRQFPNTEVKISRWE